MNKTSLTVAAALVASLGTASAADLKAKMYTKAPAIEYVSPWDFAFGASIATDYRFRGVTQSNREASVAAYFEPRYNVTKDLQLYMGVGGASISFTNRAAAEIDVYAGIRPTFGALAFDFGVFGYIYPGGQCIESGFGVCPPGSNVVLPSFNALKKDVSFYEVYAKATYTFNDFFAMGANAYYTPSFLNSGADGTYASVTGKVTMPGTIFGTSGVGAFISGEFGRQWLGTTDAFYRVTPAPVGINYKDYNTWNVGIGFTYKVFTLDLRYSDTDLSKGNCNAFTGDFTATQTGFVTPINPGGFGSTWCGATGIAKFSADLTAMSNLK